jgi:prepilin-type N-terminal cleavage/methylation domain-containing protein
LPELLVTIAILGILLAIAIIVWLGILEQRRVDAAMKQFVADLRLAHSSATNQLTDWRVVYRDGQSRYHLIRLEAPCPESACVEPRAVRVITRDLPSGTRIVETSNGADPVVAGADRFDVLDPATLLPVPTSVNQPGSTSTIEFDSDGSSNVASGPDAGLKVGSSSNPDRCYKITVRAATSRVAANKSDGCV